MQTISAIDVGSNTIRTAAGRVSLDQNKMEVIENVRIAVRLGQDVFSRGYIGEPGVQAALEPLLRFRLYGDGTLLLRRRECFNRGNQ